MKKGEEQQHTQKKEWINIILGGKMIVCWYGDAISRRYGQTK